MLLHSQALCAGVMPAVNCIAALCDYFFELKETSQAAQSGQSIAHIGGLVLTSVKIKCTVDPDNVTVNMVLM